MAMRSAMIGFVLGGGLVFLAFVIFQRMVIKVSADDFNYRFRNYVFFDSKFPWGFLVQGRVINRCFYPVKITTTFYNAQFQEVTQADKPGRYGAVVRIGLNGGVVIRRYITLYRTPVRVYWYDGPMTVSAKLPTESGIDPAVLQNQSSMIGEFVKKSFSGQYDDSPDIAVLLAGLSETSPNDPPAVERTDAFAKDAEWWVELQKRIGQIETYPYFVELPKGYDVDPGKKWPLILYLHGGAERGRDPNVVRGSGLPKAMAGGRDVPAIVVAPQDAAPGEWNIPLLTELLDEVSAKYRVDSDRIYLTGISLGGDGAWDLALAHPERIAAIAPIAGESDPADATRVKDMPIWAFVGLKDEIVQPIETTGMVDAVRRAGGRPHLTAYPDSGHACWDQVYATDALYTWLFAQKRGQPEVVTPGVPVP